MAPYLGLRGAALNQAIIWLVVCPAFVCYGYNQGVTGGLLTLNSFNQQFPQMNTLTTTGEQQHSNSTIQGEQPDTLPALHHPISKALCQERSSPCIPSAVYSAPYPASTSATSSAVAESSS